MKPDGTLMRIRDWSGRFENNRTKELRTMIWRPEFVEQDDLYAEIVAHADGAAHFGALTAIRNVAARGMPRGYLVKADGRPHDPKTIALVTRLPENLIVEVVGRLLAIGELEFVAKNSRRPNGLASQEAAGFSQDPAGKPPLHNKTGHNTTEKKENPLPSTASPSPAGLEVLSPLEAILEETARAIHGRHPAVRRCGLGEVRKALAAIARRAPAADRLALLGTINENHCLWCASEQWTKDGGEFAKGLDNWLAPTKERFLAQPEQANGLPARPMSKSEQSLAEASQIFEAMNGGRR